VKFREKQDKARVSVTAEVPEELLATFVQYIRDFDAAHEGCHMEIVAMTEQGIRQVEEWLAKIQPTLPYRRTIRKQ